MKNRTAQALSLAVIIAMFVVMGWTYQSAPSRIPIHWDIAGQVNGYGSKFFGLFLMPVIALAGYELLGFMAALRPDQFDEQVIKALSWFRLAYVLVIAGAFGVIVGASRGANINVNYVMFSGLALMMIASVNLVVQLSRLKSRKAPPTPRCGGVLP